MHILIVGAGATGGYFGGRLLQAGQDVTFLVRAHRFGQLVQHGLVVRSALGNIELPAPATVQARELPDTFDLIIVSCKAYHLPQVIEDMAPALDRMADVLLHTDVGPILDAADPLARDPAHGIPGRTVGAMASRHDPYFEQRVHASIYRGADKLARASAAFAAAAPAIAHSMHELRRSLREAARAWRDAYENGPDAAAPDTGIPTGD